jgi:hypothetical protein
VHFRFLSVEAIGRLRYQLEKNMATHVVRAAIKKAAMHVAEFSVSSSKKPALPSSADGFLEPPSFLRDSSVS